MGAGSGDGAGAGLKTSAARAAPRERAKTAQVETDAFRGPMGPLGPVIPLSPTRTGMGVTRSTAPAAQTRRSSKAQNVSNYERTSVFLSHFNRQRESHFPFHIILAAMPCHAMPCQAPRGLAGSAGIQSSALLE